MLKSSGFIDLHSTSLVDKLFNESQVKNDIGKGMIANMQEDSLVDKLMKQRMISSATPTSDASFQGFGVGTPRKNKQPKYSDSLTTSFGLKKRKKKILLEEDEDMGGQDG